MSTTVDEGLVFDIGMHRGEDTAFYLSRGFRVVGVEANPELVDALRLRFAAAIAAGMLTILPVALGPERGNARFALAGISGWSTADAGYLALAQRYTDVEFVDVEMITIGDVIARHGMPYYMKIDIEGMDRVVVAGLAQLGTTPPRLSMESVTTGAGAGPRAVVDELRLLHGMGYRRFKLVDQSKLARLEGTRLSREGRPVVYAYESEASGPFGDEAPGRWHHASAIAPEMMWRMGCHHLLSGRGWVATTAIGSRVRAGARDAARSVRPGFGIRHRWYDLHAAR